MKRLKNVMALFRDALAVPGRQAHALLGEQGGHDAEDDDRHADHHGQRARAPDRAELAGENFLL